MIDRSVADDGPLTRPQLRERLERAGIPNLSSRSCTSSSAPRSRDGSSAGRWSAASTPLPGSPTGSPRPAPTRDVALAELARRYLAGHGPAGDRDLARWAGLPLRDARAGLRAIGARAA